MVYPHYDPFMLDKTSTFRNGDLADTIVGWVIPGVGVKSVHRLYQIGEGFDGLEMRQQAEKILLSGGKSRMIGRIIHLRGEMFGMERRCLLEELYIVPGPLLSPKYNFDVLW